MSGIVVLLNLDGAPVDRDLLARMTRYLAFRGPDRRRTHLAKNAGFGHVLLRIADEGKDEEQPFTLDGQTWVVADARIDAREDLIADLRGREPDECSPDATDAELICRAYRVWGEDCVTHLLGDFTFVLWDQARHRLFGARDHLGVKPFFYAQIGRTVVISNTLDCLRLHPAVSDDLNEPAIADFLLFGANQELDTTTFRDIRRLAPAHFISWSNDSTRLRRYWTLPVDEPVYFKHADDYSDRFLELLRTALRDRLRTRRAGVLMSGGLDSTTLAAIAQSVLRERSSDFTLQAFTSVYDRLIPDSERQFAGLVAAHLNIPIRYDVRDDETSIAHWDQVSVQTPEPVANPAAFVAALEFLKNAATEARVFLYGEGPDNALRYEWRPYVSYLLTTRRLSGLVRAVRDDLWMHRRVPLWSSIRQIATARRQRRRWQQEYPRWLNESFASRNGCRERWETKQGSASSQHPVRPAGHASFGLVQWQELFEHCDITGALSRTEMRHPYLDLRVLRYLLALPAMPWCRNKLVMRRSMRTILPSDVLRRKKTGIAVSADFRRAQVSGFPRLMPSPNVLAYINPAEIPFLPRSEIDLRAALRPLGLTYWLQQLTTSGKGDVNGERKPASAFGL